MLDWTKALCVRERQNDLLREAERERLALAARKAEPAVGCEDRRFDLRRMLGLRWFAQKKLVDAEPN